MKADRTIDGDWHPGRVPDNVALDESVYVETSYSFVLCRSRETEAVRIGRGSSVYLATMFDVGARGRVRVGRFCLLNGARIQCERSVEIGDFCLVSWNVLIMDCERLPRDPAARRAELARVSARPDRRLEARVAAAPVRIGRNVWIGFDSCVLPGVSIGEGSVVGARSVVMGDVPPWTVMAGNPARAVRQLEPGGEVPEELRALIQPAGGPRAT